MNVALKKIVLLLVLPWACLGRSTADVQLYVVSVPIGYGALSAYHAFPNALAHAPYALRGLSTNHLRTKLGSVRALDFEDAAEEEEKGAGRLEKSHQSSGLDLKTFLKLFAHEFEDNKKLSK